MRTSPASRLVLAILASAMAVFLIAKASAMPVPSRHANASRLRLSWTARPERIETCRVLSAEELERRPEHMRQRVECEGRFATYALTVESDDQLLHEQVVRGAGIRSDRPLYLLRDLVLSPGEHRVRVTFVRREENEKDSTALEPVVSQESDSGIFAGRAEREASERLRRGLTAIPGRLALDTLLSFANGQVIVVTFDPDRRAFRVLTDAGSRR